MAEEERNYEEEAVAQGYNPDYDGPNKVDAKTFVEKGEKIAAIAVKDRGVLRDKVEQLEGKVESLTESNREFGKYHKKTIEAQRKANATRIGELEAELAQAVTDGDGQAYTRTRAEINDLKTELPQLSDEQANAQAWDKLATQWVSENQWYNTNPTLATFADGLQERVVAEGYNGQAYFTELTRRVKEAFPDDFKNPNRSNANSVEDGGQISTGDSKEHTYANLPADAKKACDGFVKEGFMTREDYVAEYEFEE